MNAIALTFLALGIAEQAISDMGRRGILAPALCRAAIYADIDEALEAGGNIGTNYQIALEECRK